MSPTIRSAREAPHSGHTLRLARSAAGSRPRVDLADGLLLLTVGIWGLNVTVVKLLLRDFHPLELSILRFLAAAAIFFLVVSIRERRMGLARRDWGPLAIAAFFGITLNQVCFVYSLKFTTASNLSRLLASTPAWAALLVAGSRMESVGLRHWAGIAVSMLGVAAIVLTNIFWYVGMRRLGPARGTLYANIQPFIGVLFAGWILHERLSPIQLLGGVLVVGGVLVSRSWPRGAPVEATAA